MSPELDDAIDTITHADLSAIERAALGYAPLDEAEKRVHEAWRFVSRTAGRTMAGTKCRVNCQCAARGGIICELDDEAAGDST